MSDQKKVAGVVLAGGQARRMNNQDKGLVLYKGQPMISYAVKAISTIVGQVLINANRNQAQYQQFGFPVIADQTNTFDGPLAGMFAAMRYFSDAEVLVVMPCDSPLISPADLQRLLDAQCSANVDIAVAFDGYRLHPVFLALKTSLADSLQNYLQSGQRKIDRWFEQHQIIKVDFSDKPEVFLNINTLDELTELEASQYE